MVEHVGILPYDNNNFQLIFHIFLFPFISNVRFLLQKLKVDSNTNVLLINISFQVKSLLGKRKCCQICVVLSILGSNSHIVSNAFFS